MAHFQSGPPKVPDVDESDEDDYMSEAFLKKLEEQYEANSKKKTTKAFPPVRNTRADAASVLSEGLSKPIPESNIGHRLLSRMGYTKDESNQREPIDIFMRKSRAGLGVEEKARKEARIAEQAWAEQKQQSEREVDLLRESYIKQRGEQFENRKLKSQLAKIRQAEMTLREVLNLPPLSEQEQAKDPAEIDLDGDINESDAAEQQVTESTHQEEEEQHISNDVNDDDDEPGIEGDMPRIKPLRKVQVTVGLVEEPDYADLLKRKVIELRSAPFFYCFYCGHRYENQADLDTNCPGLSEDDHA